jgi:hypothetical protein
MLRDTCVGVIGEDVFDDSKDPERTAPDWSLPFRWSR